MEEKVIYVDFKSASKKSKHKNKYKNNDTKPPTQKKSFPNLVMRKIKNIFNRLFRRKSKNNAPLKYKHWL
ncbi:hypothetical protein GOM49_00775 [Clostridium bovifaecis]|uniref:Uncharacterized protein n=1 Tax=Clostridium bovifaecis TaxID=2184719 RepID=A0A6I6EJ59_9CLOT|nr:hypothetical protein GOM49_00775 [Clostridium bovifaecis]